MVAQLEQNMTIVLQEKRDDIARKGSDMTCRRAGKIADAEMK